MELIVLAAPPVELVRESIDLLELRGTYRECSAGHLGIGKIVPKLVQTGDPRKKNISYSQFMSLKYGNVVYLHMPRLVKTDVQVLIRDRNQIDVMENEARTVGKHFQYLLKSNI